MLHPKDQKRDPDQKTHDDAEEHLALEPVAYLPPGTGVYAQGLGAGFFRKYGADKTLGAVAAQSQIERAHQNRGCQAHATDKMREKGYGRVSAGDDIAAKLGDSCRKGSCRSGSSEPI